MFKSILVPIDLNQESSWKDVVSTTLKMAEGSNAELHVMTVVPDYGMAVVGSFFPADYAENAAVETEKLLKKFAAENFTAGSNVKTHVRHGSI